MSFPPFLPIPAGLAHWAILTSLSVVHGGLDGMAPVTMTFHFCDLKIALPFKTDVYKLSSKSERAMLFVFELTVATRHSTDRRSNSV